MREAGDVCFADVFNDGTGVVEFVRLDDMKYAARKLDDSKFKSHEVGCQWVVSGGFPVFCCHANEYLLVLGCRR